MDFVLSNSRLLVTTAGYAISFLFSVGIGLFVLLKSERKTTHVMFFLFNMAVAVFVAMFIFATVTTDSVLSARLWLLSANDILIGIFFLHWVLALTGKLREKRTWLIFFYALGGALLAAIALYPHSLIAGAVPKMYFNNYPVPGPLYGVLIAYFSSVAVFAIFELVRAYQTANEEMQNRLRYILFGSLVGYSTGASSFLLSYNIPVDPVFSMFFGVYSFLYAYAILKYRLMNIRVAIRRAVFSAVVIGVLSWLMFMSSFANDWLAEHIPNISRGVVPTIASIFAFGLGFYFWKKLTETDRIKQEFLTVAAHKLRTPLTRIKLAVLALEQQSESAGQAPSDAGKNRTLLTQIAEDSDHMIDLANILLEAAEMNDNESRARPEEPVDMGMLVKNAVDSFRIRARQKKIALTMTEPRTPALAYADENRTRTAAHIFLENAMSYTPEDGTITVTVEPVENEIVVSVRDTGIGVSREDLPNIFTKLFRSKEALSHNTEGLGLGLFIAKKIIEQQGGRMWFESRGENKGSVFAFGLPAAKATSR
jgi:signal transduction histidine kinase